MEVGIVTNYSSSKPAGLERFLIDWIISLSKANDIKYVVYTRAGNNLRKVLEEKMISNIKVVDVGWGRLWKEVGFFLPPSQTGIFLTGL